MAKIEEAIYNFKKIETLAKKETPIHGLDPRIKAVAAIFYIVMVVSFDKYQLQGLLPFALYPLVLIILGDLPFFYLFKKVLIIAPFALIIGVINLVIERETAFFLFSIPVTWGALSFLSIMLRFFLTVFSTFILIATTGFNTLCCALNRGLRIPAVFVNQLLFLYRYIFLLVEEGARLKRAHSLRSFGKGISLKTFSSLLGSLLLRTLARGERIHTAMLARGFDGHVPRGRDFKIRSIDIFFILGWGVFFCAARLINLPQLLGRLLTGGGI